MELEVQLTRSGDEAWGFRLVGGVDYGLPLTVMKVLPNSPAEKAGIQCGDRLSRIQDTDARYISHEEAREVMAGAGASLLIAVQRGLYEPVLDDYDPIYEPVDQDDFDQPSQPTEVQFQIQSFTEVPNFTDKPLEYRDTPIRSLPRSETASPFIVPLKPFRCFSTEPIPPEDVPPVEQPIILNPDYQDVFNKHEGDEEFLPKTRFKLPISDQYDPDGTKSKQMEQCHKSNERKYMEELSKKEGSLQRKETFVDEVKKEIESQQSKASSFEQISKEQKVTKDERTFLDKMKQEIDVQKIESTAAHVVEESIEKAVTVAQEIKQEIDSEILASLENTSSMESKQQSKSVVESKQISEMTETEKATAATAAKKFIELIDKTTDETIMQNDRKSVDVTKEIQMFEKIIEQEKSSAEQHTSKLEDIKVARIKKEDTSTSVRDISQKSESKIDFKSEQTEKVQDKVEKTSQSTKTSTIVDSHESNDTKSKMSTARLLAEQRAYTIGLQTIPHMRGSVHSSYHYNLLLKTFFIHLTDVMVALSRFILTEPVFPENKEEKNEQVVKENQTTETVHLMTEAQDISHSVSQKDHIQTAVKKNDVITQEVVQKEVVEDKVVQKIDDQEQLDVEVSALTEKRKISGSVMAQRTERKSAELTEKMGAVITEFQTKSGIEEMETKEDTIKQTSTDIKLESLEKTKTERMLETSSTAVSSESKTSAESHHEKKESKRKYREGTPTYIAIVESHVYTNKDVVLEEQFSGLTSQTSSVQSPNETQTTINFTEAQFADKLLQSTEVKKETAEVAIQETNKMFSSSIEEAVSALEKAEIKPAAIIDFVDSKVVVEDAKAVAIQEMTPVVEELKDIKDSVKLSDVIIEEHSSKLAEIAQQSEIINSTEDQSKVAFEASVECVKVSEEMITQTEAVKEVKEEAAQLKIIKKELVDVTKDVEIHEQSHTLMRKEMELKEQNQQMYEAHVTSLQEKTFESLESSKKVQESSFIARSTETTKLDASHLSLDLRKETLLHKISPQSSQSSIPSEIDTPTPSHMPPTPLTDEYVFKLEIPLPRSRGGTPYPVDPNVEPEVEKEVDEDPHIVKKKLIPHIDTTIESKIFDPPLPSPPGDKVTSPVYTKPGLRGGGVLRQDKKEEIREIERKSSLLASAIDETIKNIELYKQQVADESKKETNTHQAAKSKSSEKLPSIDMNGQIMYNGHAKVEYKVNGIEKKDKMDLVEVEPVQEIQGDPIVGYRVVPFNPDEIVPVHNIVPPVEIPKPEQHQVYKSATGEVLGSKQGIVDGLEESVVDSDVAKELGKPGMTEDKIAALISGESEMLREAHVMGLSRVLKSHMHRGDDDSSVDFKRIKPIIESLKDSEVLRALNDELVKTQEEKKKEERKWTTFMQKPSRPVPKAKFGYPGWTTQAQEDSVKENLYKVKIVKQPKPKVAPDYKPEDFNTGLLPWESRALNEPPPPPVEAEEPILVPEGTPEFLEAVDPLPESEVPDLEDTGIPLPLPKEKEEVESEEEQPKDQVDEAAEEQEIEAVAEDTEKIEEEMEVSRVAEQLMSVSNMVDPNAPLEQQLKQMQAQIAALANLPCVIQQTLELVTKQLSQISNQETLQIENTASAESGSETEENNESCERQVAIENCTTIEETNEENAASEEVVQNGQPEDVATEEPAKPNISEEEMARLKKEEQEMLEEQCRIEKQKKELMDQMRVEVESRQIKQRPTPRVGKPAPMFGPLTPQERPMVLPGGRRWRKPEDAYNEQFIAETLSAQAELIQGKAKGINFMKYEKPPVSLDHLQYSDTYKMIHNIEQDQTRRVDMRTPAYAESDYREKCRSMTPCHGKEQHISIPQQVQP